MIVTTNSTAKEVTLQGGIGGTTNTNVTICPTCNIKICFTCFWNIKPITVMAPPQVAGLNPLYPCCAGSVHQSTTGNCGCEGEFTADSIPNTFDYTLPVFASTPDGDDDITPFLLNYPQGYDAISKGDFTLQKWNGTTWDIIATLNGTTYGTPYNNDLSGGFGFDSCNKTGLSNNLIQSSTNYNYQGFSLSWAKVLSLQGTGIYKFVVYGTSLAGQPYCSSSLPYCLKDGICVSMDRTIRVKTVNCGGTLGDVNNEGNTWQLCLTPGNQSTGSEFRAESNGTSDEQTVSKLHSTCAGGSISLLLISQAAYSTIDYNIGSHYNNSNWLYKSDGNAIQVFSGSIYWTYTNDGAAPATANLWIYLKINGVIKSTIGLNVNPGSNSFVFAFPPTDGLGTNPPKLNTGDTVGIYYKFLAEYSTTCPTTEATITLNKAGSYFMNMNVVETTQSSQYPMQWMDMIRLYGTLSEQSFEIQRDEIKYQTGLINKVRDELIKNYVLKLGGNNVQRLSLDLLNRFAAYAMTADHTYLKDYNLNNPDYNINNRLVVAESGFKPKFTGFSRYGKVDDIVFKDGIQSIYRDRCCG